MLHAVATHLCINLQEARGRFCLLSRHSYTTILSMKILIIRNIRKWNRPGSPPVPCNGLLRGKEGFSWGYKGGLRGRIGERFKSSENTRYNHLCINHPERGKTNIPRAHLRSYKERIRHLCKVIGANIPRPLWRSLRVH